MHYYQFNIGDYASHTSRLKPIEDLAYRRMIDLYYLNEQPLSLCLSDVARELGLTDYLEEVTYVLNKFFIETESGFAQKRIDLEIKKYKSNHKSKIKAGKASAKARQVKASSGESCVEQVLNTSATNDELNINQEPLTNNQEPLTNNQLEEKNTPVKLDYSVLQMTELQSKDVVRIRRKNKGTALTQLIINQLAKQFFLAEQKGFSIEDSLIEWEVRGWKSFKAEWMKVSKDAQPVIGKTQEIFNQLSEIKYVRR
tara:strand:- start:70 stop:834 length:765 start_codon:yes stop_codon:yes gene_type:complete